MMTRLGKKLNFSDHPVVYDRKPRRKRKLLLHTDWERFDGQTKEMETCLCPITLPPLSGAVLR